MSVLAIDAGTTGVTALVVDRGGHDRGARATRSSASTSPRPGWVEHSPEEIWQATLEATRAALEAVRRSGAAGRRDHEPARDRAAVGPGDARLAPARDRLAGPAHRRHLPPAEGRGPRGAGHRADRAAARPVLLRHQAALDRRARAAHVGAGRGGPLRGRHRRLLPRRPDDPRHLARHRRVQRLPHPALRPRRGRLERRAVRAVRGSARGAAGDRARRGARSHAPTRGRSSGSSCRSPGSSATSSRRCSARPASTSATPSAPTAPARSSSPTPAPRWCAPTPGCCRRRPGARRTAR